MSVLVARTEASVSEVILMDRLTPLAAAFLDAEDADASASLAIGSFAVFEGPAPSSNRDRPNRATRRSL